MLNGIASRIKFRMLRFTLGNALGKACYTILLHFESLNRPLQRAMRVIRPTRFCVQIRDVGAECD